MKFNASYGQIKRVGVCHKVWLNSSRMRDTISTATLWARVHSLEFWNTQRWQRVQATRPRRARDHTRIPARVPPGVRPRCQSRIIEGLFKRLSESGAVAGAQGDKTSATIPGQ